MKRVLVILGVVLLAASLWHNWRQHQQREDLLTTPPIKMPVQLPGGVGRVEEMDFSGTALADEAWQLSEPAAEARIPSQWPSTLSDRLTELPAAATGPALGEGLSLDVGPP